MPYYLRSDQKRCPNGVTPGGNVCMKKKTSSKPRKDRPCKHGRKRSGKGGCKSKGEAVMLGRRRRSR